MSLETVIKIGKLYREAGDSWKYHDQVNWVMNDVVTLSKNKDKDGNNIITTFYELPVIEQQEKLLFDFNNLHELTNENKREILYYLNFKTSKKDAEKRYLLGDIAYSCYTNKKGEQVEGGNYRMAKDKKKSSFFRCDEVAASIDTFNRTRIELKYLSMTLCLDFACAFNRTRIELKFSSCITLAYCPLSFNRTRIELKFFA